MRIVFPALLGLAATALSVASCQDADRIPMPAATSVALVHASFEADADTFDYLRARASELSLLTLANPTRPTCRLTLTRDNQRDDIIIRKVFVYKTLRRGANASVYTYSPRALAWEVTSFPATITFDSQEAITDLYRVGIGPDSKKQLISYKAPNATTMNRIFVGDAILLTFEYEAEINGQAQRIILTPTTKTTVDEPTPQEVEIVSGPQINAPYAVVVPFAPVL